MDTAFEFLVIMLRIAIWFVVTGVMVIAIVAAVMWLWDWLFIEGGDDAESLGQDDSRAARRG